MIFTVRDLGFEIGPFLLEGWWALAARLSAPLSSFLRGFWSAGCCAGRSSRSAGPQLALSATPILLRSFRALARMPLQRPVSWP